MVSRNVESCFKMGGLAKTGDVFPSKKGTHLVLGFPHRQKLSTEKKTPYMGGSSLHQGHLFADGPNPLHTSWQVAAHSIPCVF